MTYPFWSPAIQTLTPYTPGEQPKQQNLIKLNTNENPYPPSPKVQAALSEFELQRLRLYPDPTATLLTQDLAESYALQPEEVFVGNGSDEVLALAFLAFFRHAQQPLLIPEFTYSFYEVYCDLFAIPLQKKPLSADFTLNPADYTQSDIAGIAVANPNAPTGIALPLDAIVTLLEQHPDRVVLIDEAYVDFGADSAVQLVHTYPNLLVTQTFSKSRSLAGMRIGSAFGQPHLIEGLQRVKNSFNSYPLDMLAIECARAALADQPYFQATCAKIIRTRETTCAALIALGFQVLPSAANFLFVSHPQHAAVQLQQMLREQDILVRHFNRPGIEQFLRITIGTDSDMQALLQHLTSYLQS